MIKEIKILPRIVEGAPGLPPRQLILECDGCHVIFERLYTTELNKKTRHFCGSDCWYKQSRGEQGSRGCEMATKPCGHCSTPIVKRASQAIGKEHFFCDRKCFSEYKKVNQHPNAIEALKRTAVDPQFQAFMSNHAKERLARDGHPMLGYKHTKESRAQMRESAIGKHDGELNGMKGRKHREDSKEKMSDGHSQNLVDGKGFVYGGNGHMSGWHTSPKGNAGVKMFYRSSWERDMMIHLDSNDDVPSYGYECVRIPYYDIDNHKRNYVPDFLVTYSDGRRVLVEIKPKQFLDNEKTKLKAEAARAYCVTNGVDVYEILTGEDLRKRGIIE